MSRKSLVSPFACAAVLLTAFALGSPAQADPTPQTTPSTAGAWTDPSYGDWHSCVMGGGGYLLNAVISSSDPKRMYSYGDMDGLFRSDDAGHSWRMIHGGLEAAQGRYGFAGIIASPDNPDDIAVANGDQHGPRQGIYLSTDGGKTWKKTLDVRFMGNGPFRWAGSRIAGNCGKNGHVIVASEGSGVWRSADGGQTWTDCGLHDIYFTNAYIDRSNPDRIWLCAEPVHLDSGEFTDLAGGFYRSDNGGKTWTKLDDGGPFRILQDPVNAGTLYGLFDTTVKRSTDAGVTWQDFTDGLPTTPDVNGPQDPYLAIGAGPDFTLIVQSDSKVIYRLNSGQTTWQKIVAKFNTAGWRLGYINPPANHASSIEVSATNRDHWYMTDEFGVYQSWDAGHTWTPSNQGIETTVIHTLTQNPADTSNVYLGAGDVGFWWSDDAGKVLTQTNSATAGWVGNIKCVDGSPKLPARLYAVGGVGWKSDRVYVSTDSGKSVSLVAMPGMALPDGSYACDSIAVDPSDPYSVYVTTSAPINASSGGVYHSSDGGKTWGWMGQGLPATQQVFLDNIWWGGRELAMGPDGTLLAVSANTNSLYHFDKTAGAWSTLNFPHNGGMYSIVADLQTPGRFYICVVGDDLTPDGPSGGMYRTDDDGATWTKILSGSVHSIAIDRAVKNRVAASTPQGIVVSTDAGKTWTPLEKLPNNWFYDCLAFAGSHLLAGTGGNGAFWIDLQTRKG